MIEWTSSGTLKWYPSDIKPTKAPLGPSEGTFYVVWSWTTLDKVPVSTTYRTTYKSLVKDILEEIKRCAYGDSTVVVEFHPNPINVTESYLPICTNCGLGFCSKDPLRNLCSDSCIKERANGNNT